MKLGKIKEVDIREVWKHEQYDFSKWLASEENISELGDTLNLSLTDIQTEQFVGSYRCDIICKDDVTGKSVLIENQLEQTNHDHLGKIITYASGLNASVAGFDLDTAATLAAAPVQNASGIMVSAVTLDGVGDADVCAQVTAIAPHGADSDAAGRAGYHIAACQ